MNFEDYQIVLYRNHPAPGWVAEIPALPGCYALMDTQEEALRELELVFNMIAGEFSEREQRVPEDTTSIVHA